MVMRGLLDFWSSGVCPSGVAETTPLRDAAANDASQEEGLAAGGGAVAFASRWRRSVWPCGCAVVLLPVGGGGCLRCAAARARQSRDAQKAGEEGLGVRVWVIVIGWELDGLVCRTAGLPPVVPPSGSWRAGGSWGPERLAAGGIEWRPVRVSPAGAAHVAAARAPTSRLAQMPSVFFLKKMKPLRSHNQRTDKIELDLGQSRSRIRSIICNRITQYTSCRKR